MDILGQGVIGTNTDLLEERQGSSVAQLLATVSRAGSVTLGRFAWFVVAYNIAVILWGAYVRATGSGAGCGSHWPLCNGLILPGTAKTQTLIEFTHRVTSAASLVLVAILLILCWAHRNPRLASLHGHSGNSTLVQRSLPWRIARLARPHWQPGRIRRSRCLFVPAFWEHPVAACRAGTDGKMAF